MELGTFAPNPLSLKLAEVQSIEGGGHHSFFLKKDGSLWATGYNYYGQLGDGTKRPTVPNRSRLSMEKSRQRQRPPTILSSSKRTAAFGRRATIVMDSSAMGPRPTVPNRSRLSMEKSRQRQRVPIALSSRKTAAFGPWGGIIMENWETAQEPFRSKPVLVLSDGVENIAVGYYHSLILKKDGSLWTMGRNSYGQLGDGSKTTETGRLKLFQMA